MQNNKNKTSFFELLCLNSDKKIHEFIISNGKGPKPVCPVTFADIDTNDE